MHYRIERNYGCRISDSWAYRGLKAAVLENELLRVVVLIDKGADVYEFLHKPTDTDFVWRSPWGVRDPSRIRPNDRIAGRAMARPVRGRLADRAAQAADFLRSTET